MMLQYRVIMALIVLAVGWCTSVYAGADPEEDEIWSSGKQIESIDSLKKNNTNDDASSSSSSSSSVSAKGKKARSGSHAAGKEHNGANKNGDEVSEKEQGLMQDKSRKGKNKATETTAIESKAGEGAAMNFEDKLVMDCQITPTIEPGALPLGEIRKQNNLLRKTGSARRSRGHYLFVKGKVVDEDCVPVANAVVQIWQADEAGKYEGQYELKTEWDVRDPLYDPNFGFSGTAQTDNLGEFTFLTIFPGAAGADQAPFINMRVYHNDFEELKTRMYFNKHPRNDKDAALQALALSKQPLVLAEGKPIDPSYHMEGRKYLFLITLKGINKYRHY